MSERSLSAFKILCFQFKFCTRIQARKTLPIRHNEHSFFTLPTDRNNQSNGNGQSLFVKYLLSSVLHFIGNPAMFKEALIDLWSRHLTVCL